MTLLSRRALRRIVFIGLTWWLIITGPGVLEWMMTPACDPLNPVTCEP